MLFLSFEYPPANPGGVATVAAQKVAQFAEAGWEVELLGPVSESEKVGEVRLTTTGRGRAMMRLPRAIVKSILLVLRRRVAFTYAITATYPGFVALMLRLLFGTNYVVMAHGNEFLRFRNNLLIKTILKGVYANSRAVFAISSYTAERLTEFGVDSSKIHIVYNAVDTDRFRRHSPEEVLLERRKRGAHEDTVVLLSVSRLDPRKNHLRVLRALCELARLQPETRERLRYLIAGKGPTAERIDEEVRRLGLSSLVKQIGFVPDDELSLLYSTADIFILPVVYLPRQGSVEGFGLVYLEAAACGVASIAGKAGGTADAVEHGKTGLIVDGRNVGAIAGAIQFAMSDRQRWKNFARHAQERAVSKYSLEAVFQREYRIIRNVCGL